MTDKLTGDECMDRWAHRNMMLHTLTMREGDEESLVEFHQVV